MAFIVRWIVYQHVTDTIETERVEAPTLNEAVETCREHLDEVRLRHSDRPPNGFQVLSEDGDILRQIVDRTKPV